MPSLVTKRGQQRWKGEVRKTGLPYRSKLFPDATRKSKTAAVLWEAETVKQLESEAIRTDYWTIFDWSTKYLSHAERQFVKKTYDEKRNIVKRLLRHPLFDPNTNVADITPEMFVEYLDDEQDPKELGGSGRSGNAVNVDRKNLAAAWNYGCDLLTGFPRYQVNPFKAVPKRPETRSPRYVPPLSDLWKVIDAADGQDKAMLLTYLHTAARRREIFNLQLFDLDFALNRVRLWTRKRKDGALESDWIPMTPVLKQTLESWIAERPVKDSPNVFVCLDSLPCTEQYYGQPFVQRRHFMARICKKAKVEPFGFHAIRHLTASVLWEAGLELREIQQVLRHKSPSTTERYLRKLGLMKGTRDNMAQALDRAADIIRFPQKDKEKKIASDG